LARVYFQGNAPTIGMDVFQYYSPTVYYLPGTTGWSNFSATTQIAAVLWNPVIQAGASSFGVSNGQFGFNITGNTNLPIVVEACTNLVNPVWTPVQSMTLTNGSVYFSDPNSSNYPVRYYGIGFP
jgi:hypothetical protein